MYSKLYDEYFDAYKTAYRNYAHVEGKLRNLGVKPTEDIYGNTVLLPMAHYRKEEAHSGDVETLKAQYEELKAEKTKYWEKAQWSNKLRTIVYDLGTSNGDQSPEYIQYRLNRDGI